MKWTNAIRPFRAFLAASLALCIPASVIAAAQAPAKQTSSKSTEVIRPDEPIETIYVLHYAPAPQGDAEKIALDLLRTKFTSFKRLTEAEQSTDQPSVRVEVLDMKVEDFAPPDMEMLKYYGRGVAREQAEAMQESKLAAVLTFKYGSADLIETIERANALTEELASRTQGLIWDVETRELFSTEAWRKRRMNPADHGFPDVTGHITIHAYPSGDYVRAITLGMRKFGLPDLVVEEFSWSLNDQIGNTMNFMAQALIEGATPPAAGTYDFDITRIKNERVRQRYEMHLLEDSKPTALLTFGTAKRDEGDPDNRLIEIRFDRYAGKTTHERNQDFASKFFGSADTVSYIKHNEELLETSRRAKAKLPELRKIFNAGLAPGEQMLVKAPFETPEGGNEWMWVEIVSWKGSRIEGLLNNEPVEIPTLHAGATVKVDEADVFDYLRYKADGTEEGNETGKIIEKMQR